MKTLFLQKFDSSLFNQIWKKNILIQQNDLDLSLTVFRGLIYFKTIYYSVTAWNIADNSKHDLRQRDTSIRT